MTTINFSSAKRASVERTVPMLSAAPRQWGWSGIIIGGVCGMLSGLAEYATRYIGPHFFEALTFTVGGMIIGAVVGGALGIAMDNVVAVLRR